MASSYSTNLKIELQATGENSGTWGTITNTNLGTALEQAVVGYGNPSYATDANLTLTYTDTNAAQAARALVLNVTSAVSLTATRELIVPTIQKQYIVQNNTTGSQSITVKTSGGTGITVTSGRKAHLYVNGTDVIFMDDFVDINGGAIDGTTIGASSAAAGTFTTLGATTGNITTVNATTVDTTNIEVTNLKAKDGTAAGSIADSTGVVTLASSVLTTTDINGGTIDGTTIGGSSAAAGTFTTLTASSIATFAAGSAAAPSITTTGDTNTGLFFPAADTIAFTEGGVEAARFDSSGNLGIGVVPSAWGRGKAFEVGSIGSAIWADTGSNDIHDFLTNAYIATGDLSSGWRYAYNGFAVRYEQISGQNRWYTAPSGTAGNAITFTQAMTLDASGNLLTGSATVSGSGLLTVAVGNTTGGAVCAVDTDGARIEMQAAGALTYLLATTNHPMVLGTNNTERARITSTGGLLVGNTSAQSYSGTAPITELYTTSINNTDPDGGTLALYSTSSFAIDKGAGTVFGFKYNTAGNFVTAARVRGAKENATDGNFAGYLAFDTRANGGSLTERARLDSSGNLGLGVTPSAWDGTFIAFEGGASTASNGQGSLFFQKNGDFTTALGSNFYYSAGWKYKTTNAAGRFEVTKNTFQWFNAASGSADAAISFTQAMTLTAAGTLCLGRTSAYSGNVEKFSVQATGVSPAIFAINAAGASDYNLVAWNNATSGDNKFLGFFTETSATERGSIDYNRAGGLTRYNTTSDYRAKDILGPVQNSGATIDALKVYEGQMKGATQSRPMLIAHEAQEYAPYAVSGVKDEVKEDGTPKYQQIDVSAFVPLLLAEMQSLRKRVAELESK